MYRTNKWPKKKGHDKEEGPSTFSLGMVFTPELMKAEDLEPIAVPPEIALPRAPGRFHEPPMQ